MAIDGRLLRTLHSVFGEQRADLTETDGLGTIRGWDSAGHLSLIMALESEFGIEFDTDEFAELTNLGAISRRITEE